MAALVSGEALHEGGSGALVVAFGHLEMGLAAGGHLRQVGDGNHLHLAADLGHTSEYNHKFWQEFRKTVKTANPEAIILAEHYGDPSAWLDGSQWDTVMNYDAFMEPVGWFLTGMDKHSDVHKPELQGDANAFFAAMTDNGARFTMPSALVAMNELSNHDHSRFLTRTNHKVGRTGTLGPQAAEQGINKSVFMEGVVMQMTWIGAPTIYYGDEAGLCGFTDPDNRRTYPWGREDQRLISFHRDLIRLRKEYPELRTGSIKPVVSDYNLLGYARFTKEGQTVILINNNDYPLEKDISVWQVGTPKVGKMETLLQTAEEDYTLGGPIYELHAGKLHIVLPKTSATILTFVREGQNKPEEPKTPEVQEEKLTPEEEMRRKRRFIF